MVAESGFRSCICEWACQQDVGRRTGSCDESADTGEEKGGNWSVLSVFWKQVRRQDIDSVKVRLKSGNPSAYYRHLWKGQTV